MNFSTLSQHEYFEKAKGILLDLDNTLYEYAPCHRAGFSAAFAVWVKVIPNSSEKGFMSAYAEAREKTHARLAGQSASHSRFLYFQEMGEKKLGKTNVALTLLLEKAYWDAFLETMTLRAGVQDSLLTLRERGIRVCVVTDLTTRLQCEKLERLGISEHIEYLVSSEEAGAEKPSPLIFELALQKLGLSPEETVVIGDDEERDIAGAGQLGIPAILITP